MISSLLHRCRLSRAFHKFLSHVNWISYNAENMGLIFQRMIKNVKNTEHLLPWPYSYLPNYCLIKLASFKEDQRPNRSNASGHVGAAVLVHVARSGRSDAALRWMELKRAFFYWPLRWLNWQLRPRWVERNWNFLVSENSTENWNLCPYNILKVILISDKVYILQYR